MPPRFKRLARRPGIALLLALSIVVVLTAFLSELFLDTGLEVHAVANFRDSDQAQSLARSAFKALELSLKSQSEQNFALGYFQLNGIMKLTGVPFESGLLTRMQVTSLDGLYNVNELASVRPGTGADMLRWALFRNAVLAVPLPSEIDGKVTPPLTERQLMALYGALVDWIDTDDIEYNEFGVPGAERRSYGSDNPEYQIKNAPLEVLEEMRLIRGYAETHLPWSEMEKRFVALPASGSTASYVAEKLDVNLATAEQISLFLSARHIDDPKVLEDAQIGPIQKNINDLADKADAIAALVAAEGMDRAYFKDMNALQAAIQGSAGSSASGTITPGQIGQVFEVCSKYLQIGATVAVNGAKANLDAQVRVTRGSDCGPASKVEVLRYTLR